MKFRKKVKLFEEERAQPAMIQRKRKSDGRIICASEETGRPSNSKTSNLAICLICYGERSMAEKTTKNDTKKQGPHSAFSCESCQKRKINYTNKKDDNGQKMSVITLLNVYSNSCPSFPANGFCSLQGSIKQYQKFVF